jgi:hypothetical protein
MDRTPSELWDRDKQNPARSLPWPSWPAKIAQASLETPTQPDLAPLTLSQRAMREAGLVVEQELANKTEHKIAVLLTATKSQPQTQFDALQPTAIG